MWPTLTADAHVTLHEEAHYDGKRYQVRVDDLPVGHVEQVTMAFDRKPRGSRIATTRTQSRRWVPRPGDSWNYADTRWFAIAKLLRATYGPGPYKLAETLARGATVIKPDPNGDPAP